MRSFKLTIAYDGTDFFGWQVQPERPTIQGHLQAALREIAGQDIQVVGSGRTDAGVHALGQVASCALPWRDAADRLGKALNSKLPETIVVTSCEDAAPGFHAIRDATGKRYRYQLQLNGNADPFGYRYRWRLRGEIDVDRMAEAAKRFVGTHDFASFQATGSDRKTTVRDVRACDLALHDASVPGSRFLTVEVEANGFLYNMVRNIVGTLVEVGRGKQSPEWIDQVMAACDRDVAGPTAPAHALFLLRVDYE